MFTDGLVIKFSQVPQEVHLHLFPGNCNERGVLCFNRGTKKSLMNIYTDKF